jgi:putative flippase GtrA
MRALILEAGSYGLASAAAFCVDACVLFVLAKAVGTHYLLAAATSFIAGGVFLYFVSIRFVFRYRRIANQALELPYFIALGGVGLCVNLLVMYVAVAGMGAPLALAKLGAAVCTFGVSYLLRRQFLFVRGATE